VNVLRTPDARFAALADYAFAPTYHQVTNELRLHYVDVGPREAAPVLMLHGEPTWSYLYRHVIPPVAAAGHRVLAPDLIGFGKSDKPAQRGAHTYANQVAWIRQWVEALDLRDITLVCQDWGSLIGLRVATAVPERFARIIIGNGGLPTGEGAPSNAFRLWRAYARWSPWFPIGKIVQIGTRRALTAAEQAAYDAPFPTAAYKAAARVYPTLVPITPADPASEANREAWRVLERWEKPFICCYSDGDPITHGLDRFFLERVPGAKGRRHVTLRGGHFMQEDDSKALADLVIDACRADRANA
jgi:haloalkane dehalogenase